MTGLAVEKGDAADDGRIVPEVTGTVATRRSR